VFARIAAVKIFSLRVPVSSLVFDGLVVVVEDTSGVAFAEPTGMVDRKEAVKVLAKTMPNLPNNNFLNIQ